jgi:ribose 1,5-bisphosphokinase PhnN
VDDREGHREHFTRLPLLIVSGASGTGKSTVCRALSGTTPNVVVLDADVLWRSELQSPDDNYGVFADTWLRVCKNIHYSGRSVVLFGAGLGVPANIERRIERRYFSAVRYLALVCDEDVLAERLRTRPRWRGAREQIDEQLAFNRWFCERHASEVNLLDTTRDDVSATATACAHGLRRSSRVPEPLPIVLIPGLFASDGAPWMARQGGLMDGVRNSKRRVPEVIAIWRSLPPGRPFPTMGYINSNKRSGDPRRQDE